jgi:hypothetical protein
MTTIQRTTLLLACLLAACHGTSSNPTQGAGTINGIVSDIGTGARLSGAAVSGGGQSATTDAKGEFTLAGLAAGNVTLSISKSGYAPGYANGKAGDSAQVVPVSLKKQGAQQSYAAGSAVTLSEKTEAGPYAVIFQPNSLDTTDANLKVSVTPLDPTKERSALPGSLVTGGASPSLLLPVTFAEFTILDSAGKRVNLKSSASAMVELPIPPSLRSAYPSGAKIHCYAYNPATGVWEDFVEGTVQTSSVDGVSPVLAASVRHFSWYGGAPQGNNCVDVYVTVVSAVDGKPLPNARVEASPGTVAYTDGNGSALVRTALGTQGGSTYTAYQTGYDVDGSLTGIKGAKYIEFGQVQEDVVGLVTKSCSAPFARPGPEDDMGALRQAVVGSQGTPLVIKVGVVKNLLYQVSAILTTGSSGSAIVVLSQGVPGPDGTLVNPSPASGAKITIAESGGTPIPMPEIASGTGYYSSSGGAVFIAGKSYSLAIDADGNGSIDATSTIVAVGNLAFVNPTNGANVAAANLTASWSDTGTAAGNAAYAPVYLVIISSTSTGVSDAAYYTGTDRQFKVTSYITPGAPLKPGTYRASLLGFSGYYAQTGGGLQVSNNVTGAGVTGTFGSFAGAAGQISFTVH